jgi:hypothetical protein
MVAAVGIALVVVVLPGARRARRRCSPAATRPPTGVVSLDRPSRRWLRDRVEQVPLPELREQVRLGGDGRAHR